MDATTSNTTSTVAIGTRPGTSMADRCDRLRPHPITGEVYRRRDWRRSIHPAWSDPDDHVGNLLAEISDMNSRSELLSPSDESFLIYVITRRIRTFRDKSQGIYLTDRQQERLQNLTLRYTRGHLAARFLRFKTWIEAEREGSELVPPRRRPYPSGEAHPPA